MASTAERKHAQQESVSEGIDGALEALERKNGRDPNYVYDPTTETAVDSATGATYGVMTWNPTVAPNDNWLTQESSKTKSGKIHVAMRLNADGTLEFLHDSRNRPIVRKQAKEVSALLSALRLARVIQ